MAPRTEPTTSPVEESSSASVSSITMASWVSSARARALNITNMRGIEEEEIKKWQAKVVIAGWGTNHLAASMITNMRGIQYSRRINKEMEGKGRHCWSGELTI